MSYGAVANCLPNQIPTASGCKDVNTSGGGLISVASDFWNKTLFGPSGADPLTILLMGFSLAYFIQAIFGPSRRSRGRHRKSRQLRRSSTSGARSRRVRRSPAPSTDTKEELKALIDSGAKVRARK